MYQHWLQRHIPRYLHITRATHVQDIIDCAPLQFGEVISNQVAKKLKTCLLPDDMQSHRTSFRTIPTLITRFQQILLLAVALDANNNILVLACAIGS